MASIKIKGDTSGSTTITAPATGSDESIELSTALAAKLDLAGGRIIQVVRATDSTNRTTTSSSYVDASISVTITPEIATSAILVVWSARVFSPTDNALTLRITDSSNNPLSGAEEMKFGTTVADASRFSSLLIGYSTPATTSAVTYKGRFLLDGTGLTGNGSIDNASNTGQMYAIEVSA